MKPAIEHAARLAATDPQAAYDLLTGSKVASADSFASAFQAWAGKVFDEIAREARGRGWGHGTDEFWGMYAETEFSYSGSHVKVSLRGESTGIRIIVIPTRMADPKDFSGDHVKLLSFDMPIKAYVTEALEVLY